MFKELLWKVQDAYADMQNKKLVKKYKQKWPDYVDDEYNFGNLKFIWGVLSYDDLSSSYANMFTMNDIDIIYDRDSKQYMLGIETIYMFKDTKSECAYYRHLLELFTEYMKDNKFDTELNYCTAYNDLVIDLKADSIEELYTRFKIIITGLCSVWEERGNYEYY